MVEIRPIEDGESGDNREFGDSFSDAVIRNKFIRKVYSILTIQLTFTTIVVGIFVLVEELQIFVKQHRYLLWIAMIVFIVTYFIISCGCCVQIRRAWPWNIIILMTLTVALSFLASVIACQYKPYSVLASLSATVIITFGLTIFAIQTKHDFTSCAGFICMLSLFFMAASVIISIIFAFNGYNKIVDMVFCAFGVVLFMIYIVYDTQLIIGGKDRQHQISPEDYVYGATQLYVDIVQLFLYLLQLIGDRN